jgi:hypothetical protein
MVLAYKARGPVAVAPTIERVREPAREEERCRLGDSNVWEHGAQDIEHFPLDLRVGEGFNALRIVSLYLINAGVPNKSGNTHYDSSEDYSRAREEAFEIQTLPDRIFATFCVRIQSKLESDQTNNKARTK